MAESSDREVVVDQFAVAIEPVRACVEAVVGDLRSIREGRGFDPLPKSPAERDAVHDDALRGALGQHPVSDARLGALILCSAAEDHALGLTAMLATHHPPFAHQPPARAALECAARASHLIEPGLTPLQRVGRWTNERLYSLAEQKKLVPLESKSAADRTKHILDGAVAAGLTKAPTRKGRPPQVLPVREHATRLVGRLLLDGDDTDGFGALTYRWFSATTHGTVYALYQRVEPLDLHDADDLSARLGAIRATADDVNSALVAVLHGLTTLARDVLTYFGWDEPDLAKAIDNAHAIARLHGGTVPTAR